MCLFRVHILDPRKIRNIKRKSMTRLQTVYLRSHVLIPDRSKIHLSSWKHLDQLWGQSCLPLSGSWGLFSLIVNWPGHEADNLPAPSAKVKNEWCCSSIPPYSFIMHRNSFTYLKHIKLSQLFLSLKSRSSLVAFILL